MTQKLNISADEQKRLAAVYHSEPGSSESMAAREQLVRSQVGLVRQIAYTFAPHSWGFEVDDLIQAGLMAVSECIRWYRPHKGELFSTYAAGCVRQQIDKYLKTERNKPFMQEAELDSAIDAIEDRHVSDPDRFAGLRAALDGLPQPDRMVVEELSGLNGQAAREIDLANRLGVSKRIVRMIFERGKARLREAIPQSSHNYGETV